MCVTELYQRSLFLLGYLGIVAMNITVTGKFWVDGVL